MSELEWEIDDDDYASTPGAVWAVCRPLVNRADIWNIEKNGAEVHRQDSMTKDEMKSLAQQLQDVLNGTARAKVLAEVVEMLIGQKDSLADVLGIAFNERLSTGLAGTIINDAVAAVRSLERGTNGDVV